MGKIMRCLIVERNCCKFISGAPTTFQCYGIEYNRIECSQTNSACFDQTTHVQNAYSHVIDAYKA